MRSLLFLLGKTDFDFTEARTRSYQVSLRVVP